MPKGNRFAPHIVFDNELYVFSQYDELSLKYIYKYNTMDGWVTLEERLNHETTEFGVVLVSANAIGCI